MSASFRAFLIFISGTSLIAPAFGQTDAPAQTEYINMASGPLRYTLTELGAETGASLLFSPAAVGDLRSPVVKGSMTIDEALRRMLAGSGLLFRRTAAGSIIVYSALQTSVPETIPEILVIGRRTQNVDIRRTENDIQPYNVATSSEIISANPDDVSDFLRTRLTADDQVQTAAQDPRGNGGSVRSEANLHGLGSSQTLVLVDGARMPEVPDTAAFLQPDVNGIPIAAIDRIESLTGTAGGIYGPGATGGVINIVLKRDYRGADASVNYGLSEHGDAQRRVDGRVGFTPDGGQTDVMIAVSHSNSDGLVQGNNDYLLQSRALLLKQTPLTNFIDGDPVASALIVQSASGSNLELKNRLGGIVLGSQFSYLGVDSAAATGSPVALLLANAGIFPNTLPADGNGTGQSILSSVTTTSLLLNIRHRFGGNIEAFIDLIRLDNDGRGVTGADPQSFIISNLAPTNPFAQPVIVSFPMPGFNSVYRTWLTSTRLSAGLILHLPYGWKAEGDLRGGGVNERINISGFAVNNDAGAAIALNVPGAGGEPALNPFGNWNTFVTALQQYKTPQTTNVAPSSRFRDASLRLAGPLFSTKAGEVTLSLLAEARSENVGSPVTALLNFGNIYTTPGGAYSQSTISTYGELRAPIQKRDAGPWPFRGLELQAAIRWDANHSAAPGNFDLSTNEYDLEKSERGSILYTIGLRSFPSNWLMVRASLSTGELSPTPLQLITNSQTITYGLGPDPKRGGQQVGSEAPFELLTGGSPRLRSEKARTFSVGFVINPEGPQRNPRISLDFTQIKTKLGVSDAYDNDLEFFLQNESSYPGRVVRAPLTVADVAAGYTGGVVTEIDTSAMNSATSISNAIDLQLDGKVVAFSGTLHPYGSATWEPQLTQRLAPGLPAMKLVGYLDGPLRWRTIAGLDWGHDRLKLGINGEYYGGYHAILSDLVPLGAQAQSTLDLPGIKVAPQVYFDLAGSYRIDLASGSRLRSIDVRFGLKDLFDKRPPTTAYVSTIGYSSYGDPRQRRFELTMASHW